MDTEIKQIISRLEQQAKAITSAISALKDLDGAEADVAAVSATPARPAAVRGRKGGLSEEGRERIRQAQRARWMAKRAADANVAKRRGRPKAA